MQIASERILVQRGIKDKEKINSCVYGPKDRALDKCKKKIIIDEFFWNPYYYQQGFLRYHCAVSSSPLKLFVYNKKGKKLIIDKDEIYIPKNKC